MTDVRTFLLDGVNADTVSYTLAPGLAQFIQAVYIEVDNTAGGDARPTLSVSEQSGVVIAKKRQGEAIAAGDTGSATWALRLTDEGSVDASGFIRYDVDNVGDWLNVVTTGAESGSQGMSFETQNGNDINFTADPVHDGFFTVDAGKVSLQAEANPVEITALNGHSVFIESQGGVTEIDGALTVFPNAAGQAVTILDHSGNVKWRWTEGTTVLHGPVGGSIVFDLP